MSADNAIVYFPMQICDKVFWAVMEARISGLEGEILDNLLAGRFKHFATLRAAEDHAEIWEEKLDVCEYGVWDFKFQPDKNGFEESLPVTIEKLIKNIDNEEFINYLKKRNGFGFFIDEKDIKSKMKHSQWW